MEKTNNNSQDNSKSISYTMSDQLVSALRSNMKEFKEALVKRRDEVIANFRLLHVVLTKHLESLREQEEAGMFFRAPNSGAFMGKYKPHDISMIIVTKQHSNASKIRIAVSTVDDQVVPDSELGNIPLNQLIQYAYFVQERLESMTGRRMFRSTYLQEYLDVNDLDTKMRGWGGNSQQYTKYTKRGNNKTKYSKK
jgi:hypothetical protein